MSNISQFTRDNKFFYTMEKLSKLVILNLLMILFSLPLVTLGAALTAMHPVLRSLLADDEGNIFLEYWRAFRENFWKATWIWLIFAAIGGFLVWDYMLLRTGRLPEANWLQWPIYIIAVLTVCCAMWSFILQSHYENKLFATVRNGFLFIFLYFVATVMMVMAAAVPFIMLYLSLYFMPVVLLFGFSGVGLLQAMLYTRIFDRLDSEKQTHDDR